MNDSHPLSVHQKKNKHLRTHCFHFASNSSDEFVSHVQYGAAGVRGHVLHLQAYAFRGYEPFGVETQAQTWLNHSLPPHPRSPIIKICMCGIDFPYTAEQEIQKLKRGGLIACFVWWLGGFVLIVMI